MHLLFPIFSYVLVKWTMFMCWTQFLLDGHVHFRLQSTSLMNFVHGHNSSLSRDANSFPASLLELDIRHDCLYFFYLGTFVQKRWPKQSTVSTTIESFPNISSLFDEYCKEGIEDDWIVFHPLSLSLSGNWRLPVPCKTFSFSCNFILLPSINDCDDDDDDLSYGKSCGRNVLTGDLWLHEIPRNRIWS